MKLRRYSDDVDANKVIHLVDRKNENLDVGGSEFCS